MGYNTSCFNKHNNMKNSNCCQAPITEEGFCTECKENCVPLESIFEETDKLKNNFFKEVDKLFE